MDLIALDLKITEGDLKNLDRVIRQIEKEREDFDAEKHLETTPILAQKDLN